MMQAFHYSTMSAQQSLWAELYERKAEEKPGREPLALQTVVGSRQVQDRRDQNSTKGNAWKQSARVALTNA